MSIEQLHKWQDEELHCEMCQAFRGVSRVLLELYPVGKSSPSRWAEVAVPLGEAEEAHRRRQHPAYWAHIRQRASKKREEL